MELKELENVKVNDVKVLRSEVWYVDPVGTIGSEQRGERPAVIVSNDIGNKNAPIVEIIYITTQIKPKLPTHVQINNFKLTGTALCENVTTIDKSRLKSRLTLLSDQQMTLIEKAMCISLDITKKPETRQSSPSVSSQPSVTVMAIPGEDDNYIIRQANDHLKKVFELGSSLSIVEDELTKICQADITLGGVTGDYLTEELKDEIRSKASEGVRSRKASLENELLDCIGLFVVKEQKWAEVEPKEDKPVSKKSLQQAEHDLDFEEVKRLYLEEGYSIAKLCQEFKRSSVTMGTYLKEHGIIKPWGGHNRKPR